MSRTPGLSILAHNLEEPLVDKPQVAPSGGGVREWKDPAGGLSRLDRAVGEPNNGLDVSRGLECVRDDGEDHPSPTLAVRGWGTCVGMGYPGWGLKGVKSEGFADIRPLGRQAIPVRPRFWGSGGRRDAP